MATFKAVVQHQYIRADKTFPVKIRVTQHLKSRYIDTGLVATMDDLTKKYKFKKESSFLESANAIIKKYRKKCNEYAEKVSAMDITQLVSFLKSDYFSDDGMCFIKFSEDYIEKMVKSGKEGTARNYTTALNCFKRFVELDSYLVTNINVAFLQKFDTWIKNNPQKENTETDMNRARSLYLGIIRKLHNEMKGLYNDEENGIILIPGSPFDKFKLPKPQKTRKRAISPELIKGIYELPDEDIKNSTGISRYNLAKDCFILSFCLMGMNSADLYYCDHLKGDKLTYKRMKTTSRRDDHAEIQIWIQPEIKELMKKYKDPTGKRVFRFHLDYTNERGFNKSINKGLKKVSEKVCEVINKKLKEAKSKDMVSIDDLEFYSARHSFASIAQNKVGIDPYTVHESLNHAVREMNITKIYIDKDWGPINQANRKVLDFVFNEKAG